MNLTTLSKNVIPLYGDPDWRAIPKTVKVKKTMGQNGYYKFEVKGVSFA